MREILFLQITLGGSSLNNHRAPDDFVRQLAAKLALKGYSLFDCGSTGKNCLPTDLLISSTAAGVGLSQMFDDFRGAVLEFGYGGYESGYHYTRVSLETL
jgi:hypothetical protein